MIQQIALITNQKKTRWTERLCRFARVFVFTFVFLLGYVSAITFCQSDHIISAFVERLARWFQPSESFTFDNTSTWSLYSPLSSFLCLTWLIRVCSFYVKSWYGLLWSKIVCVERSFNYCCICCDIDPRTDLLSFSGKPICSRNIRVCK